jgi:hypothetical protein
MAAPVAQVCSWGRWQSQGDTAENKAWPSTLKETGSIAADEILETVNSRDYRPGKVITLEEFSIKWKRDALILEEEGSQKAAKSHLNVHLVPMLGKEKLENIHQHLIQSMVAVWPAKG